MAAYNAAPFIQEALASLQAQTIRNIQIVVVDDGSTDNTPTVLQRIADQDARIKVVGGMPNHGLAIALNMGLVFCTAPYIARMDADDIAAPDRLEKQLYFLETHPDIALVGCGAVRVREDGTRIESYRLPLGEKAIKKFLPIAIPCLHIWMAHRWLYVKLCGYRNIMGEDHDFVLRAVTSGFRIANLPDKLMRIRFHHDSLTRSTTLRAINVNRYVIRLYHERLKYGTDSFSRANYEKIIRLSGFGFKMGLLGEKIMSMGIDKPRHFRRMFRVAAAFVSPYHARELWKGIRCNLALWSSAKGSE
jgi:glycosyltransferase involved in cell wall biosynthesis